MSNDMFVYIFSLSIQSYKICQDKLNYYMLKLKGRVAQEPCGDL